MQPVSASLPARTELGDHKYWNNQVAQVISRAQTFSASQAAPMQPKQHVPCHSQPLQLKATSITPSRTCRIRNLLDYFGRSRTFHYKSLTNSKQKRFFTVKARRGGHSTIQ